MRLLPSFSAIASALLLVVATLPASLSAAFGDQIPLYIGTAGAGIYVCEFDTESGEMTKPQLAATTPNPTFLTLTPDGKSLISISELYGQSQGGPSITRWQIQRDGTLQQTSTQSALGDGPCYVTVRDDGKFAATANYGGGSVALFPLGSEDIQPASGFVQHTGSSVNSNRQKEPHAHSIRFDPSGGKVVAADLGTDKVYVYDITADGSLSPSTPAAIDIPPGSGPRHLTFSADGKTLYVLGELTGTITTIDYASNELEVLGTVSTMAEATPDDASRGSAEIIFDPAGKFLYASNRGPSEIAVFQIDPQSRQPVRTGATSTGGKTPRNFRFSPDGKFLIAANQNSDSLVVFAVDSDTGALTPTRRETSVPKPMCLKFGR